MLKDFLDDKIAVIFALLVLGVASLVWPPEDFTVIIAIVAAMGGLAVGKSKKD